MDRGWVDAAGRSLERASIVDLNQLELGMPGTPSPNAPVSPDIIYWASSLAPEELDDLGCFEYDHHPSIFLGRTGFGPMRVACDTNVLIDILDNGHRLRGDADDPDGGHLDADDDEIQALLMIMWLWTSRDIRSVFSERQARDHRVKGPGRLDVDERHGEIDELNAGWAHVVPDDMARIAPMGLPEVAGLPPNTDTELIRIAIAAGCHVFLTRDKPVAARAPRLRPFGLAVMRPTTLLAAIDGVGDLQLTGPDGGVCDNHKWVHLDRVTRRP